MTAGRCKAQVGHGFIRSTCARKAVQDGYCNQHHPTNRAKARAARNVEWDRKFSERSAMHKRVSDEAARLKAVDELAKRLVPMLEETYQNDFDMVIGGELMDVCQQLRMVTLGALDDRGRPLTCSKCGTRCEYSTSCNGCLNPDCNR